MLPHYREYHQQARKKKGTVIQHLIWTPRANIWVVFICSLSSKLSQDLFQTVSLLSLVQWHPGSKRHLFFAPSRLVLGIATTLPLPLKGIHLFLSRILGPAAGIKQISWKLLPLLNKNRGFWLGADLTNPSAHESPHWLLLLTCSLPVMERYVLRPCLLPSCC